jgi:hypothetical protein
MTRAPRAPLAREASERREGQYLSTTERRERSIPQPAVSGGGEAATAGKRSPEMNSGSLGPAKADAGEGRA